MRRSGSCGNQELNSAYSSAFPRCTNCESLWGATPSERNSYAGWKRKFPSRKIRAPFPVSGRARLSGAKTFSPASALPGIASGLVSSGRHSPLHVAVAEDGHTPGRAGFYSRADTSARAFSDCGQSHASPTLRRNVSASCREFSWWSNQRDTSRSRRGSRRIGRNHRRFGVILGGVTIGAFRLPSGRGGSDLSLLVFRNGGRAIPTPPQSSVGARAKYNSAAYPEHPPVKYIAATN